LDACHCKKMQWFYGTKNGRIKIDKYHGKKITHKNFW